MLSGEPLSAVTQVFLLISANILLITLVVGLGRALIGPSVEDRFSSLLLLGSAGVALMMILAILLQNPALYDVALVLALLAIVVTVALTRREKINE